MREGNPTGDLPDSRTACLDASPSRRAVLQGVAGAVVQMACVTLSPASVLAQDEAAARRPQPGDQFVRASDASATPLKVADLVPGPPTVAWARDPREGVVRSGSRFNQVLLVKLDPGTLDADTRARSVDGIVAYSIICPHSGCDVADWMATEQVFLCGCHSSVFDPKRGARVVDGPAPRSLPALPLGAEGDFLVVAAHFTDKVGFESA